MNPSLANKLIFASNFTIHASAPRLRAETDQEIRVTIRRSAADIEREVMAAERRKLIRRVRCTQ